MGQLLLILFKSIHRLFRGTYGNKSYFKAWNYAHTIGNMGIGHRPGISLIESGEHNLVKQILSENRSGAIVFDVGANKGEYSKMVLNISNAQKRENLSLHIFEPSAQNIPLLNDLVLKYRDKYDIHLNQLALSDEKGVATLFSDDHGSDLGSLFNLKIAVRKFNPGASENIYTTTLDDYISENKIPKIDFLKLDVEGGELSILKGALKSIQKDKIRNIQFELGTANVSSKVFFYDFWELLSSKYNFYRIMKDGTVLIEKYQPILENFVTTNYLMRLK